MKQFSQNVDSKFVSTHSMTVLDCVIVFCLQYSTLVRMNSFIELCPHEVAVEKTRKSERNLISWSESWYVWFFCMLPTVQRAGGDFNITEPFILSTFELSHMSTHEYSVREHKALVIIVLIARDTKLFTYTCAIHVCPPSRCDYNWKPEQYKTITVYFIV